MTEQPSIDHLHVTIKQHEVSVRPITPEDKDIEAAFVRNLSLETKHETWEILLGQRILRASRVLWRCVLHSTLRTISGYEGIDIEAVKLNLLGFIQETGREMANRAIIDNQRFFKAGSAEETSQTFDKLSQRAHRAGAIIERIQGMTKHHHV